MWWIIGGSVLIILVACVAFVIVISGDLRREDDTWDFEQE